MTGYAISVELRNNVPWIATRQRRLRPAKARAEYRLACQRKGEGDNPCRQSALALFMARTPARAGVPEYEAMRACPKVKSVGTQFPGAIFF